MFFKYSDQICCFKLAIAQNSKTADTSVSSQYRSVIHKTFCFVFELPSK